MKPDMNALKSTLALVTFSLLLLPLIPRATAQENTALLLFGGKNHDVFLGCLNCTETSASAVCNVSGKYGSIVSQDSIWNIVSTYGSIVSDFSPWNIVANHPPVIVDRDGIPMDTSAPMFSTLLVPHRLP